MVFTSSWVSVDVNNPMGRNPYFQNLVTRVTGRLWSTHGVIKNNYIARNGLSFQMVFFADSEIAKLY